MSVPAIETLYLRTPSWEYQQAFDLAVVTLNQGPPPALAVLSSAVHAVELLRRWRTALHLAGTGAFDAAAFARAAPPWAWGPLQAVSLDGPEGPYAALLWAEPEAADAAAVAQRLHQVAAPGATLQVIASAPLRRLLPSWREPPPPAARPLAPSAARRTLQHAGWRVESQVAIHGPRAYVWSRLSQLAAACGRPDWADRCLFAMRRHYRAPAWQWPLAPVALIRARAAGRQGRIEK